MGRTEADLERLAPLAEPLRRAIYLYVVARREDVGRDEAASVFRIGRSLAAFHLDKLSDAGLLEVGYKRLSGRTGPGAGRPSKVYRAGPRIDVTVPSRDYELAARLLLEASSREGPEEVSDVAYEAGRALGRQARGRSEARAPRGQRRRLKRALEDRGYEPYATRGELRLRNCPFHALAEEYRDTICPMNLSFIRGIIDGLGARSLTADPRQTSGGCCVFVRSAAEARTQARADRAAL